MLGACIRVGMSTEAHDTMPDRSLFVARCSAASRSAPRLPRLWAILLAAFGLSACSPAPTDEGMVRLALATVPAGVACVQVTAAGAVRTSIRNLDVAAGRPYTQLLTGLPVGTVSFSGQAFPVACVAIATSAPTWDADPVIVGLTAGVTVEITLIMHQGARVKVAIDFDPSAGTCFNDGQSCTSSTECCAGSCLNGLCAGVVIPPLSCAELLKCQQACTAQACVDDCARRASPDAVQSAGALFTCLDGLCMNNPASTCQCQAFCGPSAMCASVLALCDPALASGFCVANGCI